MSDELEENTEQTGKKRGRKASPILAASRAYDKANFKANKARQAHAKVEHVAQQLKDAEAEEAAAYDSLQEVLEGSVGLSTERDRKSVV